MLYDLKYNNRHIGLIFQCNSRGTSEPVGLLGLAVRDYHLSPYITSDMFRSVNVTRNALQVHTQHSS